MWIWDCHPSITCSAAGWTCPYLNSYSDTVLNFLFCASYSLHCGCRQMQQELPARTNGSAPTAPALAQDALHTKMEQLEEQLLSKILTLQKERQAASTDRSQQQHNIEKELNSLQNRVMELEHGEPCPVGMEVGWRVPTPRYITRRAPGQVTLILITDADPPLSSPSLICRTIGVQPS